MKTPSGWAKKGRIVSVVGAVFALAFLTVVRYSGASAGANGERLGFVPASHASGLNQTHRERPMTKAYSGLPISFEQNVGQSASEVSYLSRGSGFELFLTSEEAVLALRNPVPHDLSPRHRFATLRALREARQARKSSTTTTLRMRFEGSNPRAQVVGLDGMPGRVNYFVGNDPKKWRTDVPAYSRVKYNGLYPGVDLIFYGNGRRLEYDFVVSPGADPSAIRLNLQGARTVRINKSGDAVVGVGRGEVLIQSPVIYQLEDGKRREIAGNFVLAGHHELAFRVPKYDRSEPLILDPVLNYSTYLGGSLDDGGSAIAVDATGNVIVAGTSFSTDFPTSTNAFMPQPLTSNVNGAAFVSEIDPTGTQLKYSTYLAGSTPFEFAFGVTVDPTGKIYVTGTTVSTDFPTSSTNPNFKAGFKVSPNNTNVNGTSFIVKLDPAAATGQNSLLYSSYIGGTNGTPVIGDIGQSIAVDANGIAYVTGYTDSSAGTSASDLTGFPVVGGFQTTLGSANGNAFLAKIDTTQSGASSLLYSTYLGGNAINFNSLVDLVADIGDGVVIDSNSNAYMAGTAYSTNLAVTANAVQLAYPAGNSTHTAFLARVDTTQTGAASLGYLSYLGGTGPDFGDGVALGANNVAEVTGQTHSLNFPTTTGAFSTSGNASGQTYVTIVDTNAIVGAPPVYSTFVGGSGGDDGFGIRVDASGNAYVAGSTSSPDFPTTSGAFQSALATGAAGDGFVFKLNPGGNGSADLLYSTYFGGSGSASTIDEIEGIAIDASNNVYVTGTTASSTTFPIFPNPGAFQTVLNGPSDAFVAKLTLIPTMTVSPTSLNFGSQPVGVTSAAMTVSLTNNTSDPIPLPGTSIAFTGTNAADFASPSNTCGVSIAAAASCTVGVTFTPSAASGESATLAITVTVTDGGISGSQTFDASLSGTGSATAPGVGFSPTSLAFGNQVLNTTSAAMTVTLTNTGTNALTINSIAVSGDFAETSTGATACPISPATLPATAGSNTCTISVTFTPTAAGARAGTLTITDNAGGSPHTVPLTGTGTTAPGVGLAPTTLAFGNQLLNTTSAAMTVTLTNTGTSALTINSIAASGDFAETSTGATACPISPATLPATAGSNTCTISVTFTPTALGARAGTLTITDNAGGSPHTVPLTGTGTGTPDFGLTGPAGVQGVTLGQTLNFNVTVTGTGGFNSPVALACTGAPALAVCTVTSPVTPPVAPPSTIQAQVSMTTTAFVVPPQGIPTPTAPPQQVVPLVLALMMLFSLVWVRRPRLRLAMATAVLTLFAITGCNGLKHQQTPKGAATLTITGTSGALTHNVQVQISVN